MSRFFEYIVCLLAIYGLFAIVRGLIGTIHERITGKRPIVKVVLLVKDAEEHIEYIIRNIVKKEFKTKALSDKNVTIVDMESTDQTKPMLDRLQKDFQSFDILTYEDRLHIFDGF